jgi:phosphinothricin acetyltransferase
MHIRPAARDDVPAILDISNWAAAHTPANFAIKPEELDSWLKSYEETHHMFPWLVAVDDSGGVIGFARSSPHKGRCAYAWTAEVSVYVHSAHHGRGVGKALYGHLIPMLREQGYVTLIAGITTPNPASERLHAGCGFVRIGAFERVGWKFNKWHDVSYWQMMLVDEPRSPDVIKPVAEVRHGGAVASRT